LILLDLDESWIAGLLGSLWNLSAIPALLVQIDQRSRDKCPVVLSPLVGGLHPLDVLDDLVSTSVVEANIPSLAAG
jgi:hypothetical protein